MALVGAVATAVAPHLSGEGDRAPAPGAEQSSSAAPGCVGTACTGLDPETNGCGGARTLTDTWLSTMHLEMRYSPRCEAVWAKLTGAQVGDTVSIATSPNRRQTATVQTNHDKYTPMLPVEDGFSAQATAVAVRGKPDQGITKGQTLRITADESNLPSGAPSPTTAGADETTP